MALDFQQIRQQVRELGQNARARVEQLRSQRAQAWEVLIHNAQDLEGLRQKVGRVASYYGTALRCAVPVREPLDARFELPRLPERATILAADGSQIFPDRHSEVEYGLINVGAIQMRLGSSDPPQETISSNLIYDEQLFTLTEAMLALRRDLDERQILVKLAPNLPTPIITFTDGPMELFVGRLTEEEAAQEFQQSLEEYRAILGQLRQMNATTAGYVDKPAAQTVIRLLEIAMTSEDELPSLKKLHPLRGVRDVDLYRYHLQPGERSAVFALQTQFSDFYTGDLAMHFFYLNVGRPDHPWLVRVEAPAWVTQNPTMLSDLHAILVQQCAIMGTRPYPYALHRAHEAAVVSLHEKEQVTRMIALELRQRGVEVGLPSHKQTAKDLPGRTRYERSGLVRK